MKRISFIICIILIGADLMAQDAIHITAREGRMESLLKKKSPEQVESLVIDGTLNNTDLLYLSKLPNLRSLDISQAEMSKEFSKSLREQFLDLYTEDSYDSRVREGHYDGSNLYLSGFKELTDLSLGEDVRHLYFNQEFEKLSIPHSCIIEYVPDGGIAIENLIINDGRLFADSWTEYGIGTQSDLGNPRMSLLNDDGVPWYGFGYGHFQVLDEVKILVENLYLPSVVFLKFSEKNTVSWMESAIVPLTITFSLNGFSVLNVYTDSVQDQMPGFAAFSNAAFARTSLSTFSLPKRIKRIPSYCFAYCQKLTQFDAGEVESIGAFAFKKAALTELTLPESVKEINAEAFKDSNLEVIRMTGPAPLVYKWDDESSDPERVYVDNLETDAVFVVPSAYKGTYSVGPWANAIVMEEGAKTDFEITLSKEGELKNHLSESIIATAQRLTIKGIMNDLEFAELQRCKNLRYLDLSNCFTIKSEYTSYQEFQTNKAILEIASIKLEGLRRDNEAQYAQGWKSSGSYQAYKFAADRAKDELEKYKGMVGEWTPSTACYLPEDAFDNLPHLREVLLPKALTELNTRMPKIRKVTLPPGLKRIGSFVFKDAPIGSIKFPSSLESIGESCFMGCENLKVANLRNTSIEELTFDCFHDSGVEVLKAPHGLKRLYNGQNASRARNALVVGGASLAIPEIYFYTPTAPEGLSGVAGIKTIHIPYGYKVGWVSKIDTNRITLVDDVYPDKEDDEETDVSEKEVPSAQVAENEEEPASDEKTTVLEKEIEEQAIDRVEEEKEEESMGMKEEDSALEESVSPISIKPVRLPGAVIKFYASTLNLSQLTEFYSLGGSFGFLNLGGSRIGTEVGAYFYPKLQSSSLFGVDASIVFRVTNTVYPKILAGYFSYLDDSRDDSAVHGLCGGAGLSFLIGGHFCLDVGAKYYPEINVREEKTVITTPGIPYQIPSKRQVFSSGITPFVSIGWAF